MFMPVKGWSYLNCTLIAVSLPWEKWWAGKLAWREEQQLAWHDIRRREENQITLCFTIHFPPYLYLCSLLLLILLVSFSEWWWWLLLMPKGGKKIESRKLTPLSPPNVTWHALSAICVLRPFLLFSSSSSDSFDRLYQRVFVPHHGALFFEIAIAWTCTASLTIHGLK